MRFKLDRPHSQRDKRWDGVVVSLDEVEVLEQRNAALVADVEVTCQEWCHFCNDHYHVERVSGLWVHTGLRNAGCYASKIRERLYQALTTAIEQERAQPDQVKV